MSTLLLIALVIMDAILFWLVYKLSRDRFEPNTVLRELHEERKIINQIREALKDEIVHAQTRFRDALDKVTRLASEAEQEVSSGREVLARAAEEVAQDLSAQMEGPALELKKRQASLELLLKKVNSERALLQKSLERGEKICRFFDQKVPYEEVLREIQDKKYADARQLLAQGMKATQVAKEVGLTDVEVSLLVSVS